MFAAISAAVASGGAGYVLNDILTVSGGTLTSVTQFKVTEVNGDIVTAIQVQQSGLYDSIPNNPVNTVGGTGSGCVLTVTWTSSSSPTQPPTPRTTPDLVKGIVQVQDGIDLTPFIAIANQITTDNCTYPQSGQNPKQFIPYTDGFVGSKMELIERWLSAHAFTMFSAQLTNAKAGSVGVGFQYKIDLNLKLSTYGQTAMLLDNYGGLAALSNTLENQRKIQIRVTSLGIPVGPNGYPFADPGWNWDDAAMTVEQ